MRILGHKPTVTAWIGMGILPLQYKAGENAESLGLTGEETFDIVGLSAIDGTQTEQGPKTITVKAKSADGKDIDRLVRKELDINADGKIDISRTYDEREQISREALDLDFDGKVDQVNFYEKGVIVRKERDLSSAGKPSLWLFFEKGKLVRKERDTNGDGRVDYWEYWENDQVDRIGEDLDGDGNVDKWTKNPDSET